jgi:hypothetical protein
MKHPRKYLVDSGYQLTQAGILVAANVLVALLMAALLSWFYLLEWDGSIAYDHNRRIPLYILSLTLIVIVVATLLSLRRSRRIAGMFTKLNRLLESAAGGELPEREVSFRRSDDFRELAGPLNRCLARLRELQPERQAGASGQPGEADPAVQLAAMRSGLERGETLLRADAGVLDDLKAIIAYLERPTAPADGEGGTAQ